MKTETRKVCCNEVVCEEREVMKPCWKTVQETKMCKKLVCKGHYECRQVCEEPGLLERLCHRCDPCCDPCGKGCPRMVTKKVWVDCPVYKECPVTVCKRVCEMVPTKCKVAVCRKVERDVQVQVCSYRCQEEKKTIEYCCYETRKVPCKVTRTVRECVPYEEVVTCCRMVPREVERQVPVCEEACNPGCRTRCCRTSCCERRSCDDCCDNGHRLRGLFHGHRCGGCDSGCGH
jgi:hypothetical protein